MKGNQRMSNVDETKKREVELRSSISIPTIKRFPSYLRILRQYEEAGHDWVSATKLADELGLKPIQVRKDMSCTGVEGRPKVGFEIALLIRAITHCLGWDNSTDALVVGAGHLGSALARYEGFESYGLRIVAMFDRDPGKCGKKMGDVDVLPLEKLQMFIKENRINIAAIAVPANQAQAVADLLIKCGIKAIWNFAPKDLKIPPGVVLQRTDLATSFAVLSAKLRRMMAGEAPVSFEEEEDPGQV